MSDEAKREVDELKDKIRAAMDRANGRWCEWGGRAEMVRDLLLVAIGDMDESEIPHEYD